MTTNHHTPIAFRSPADAETFNAPLRELDTKISAQDGILATANSNIGTLQGQMSTANSAIGTLQTEMDTAQSDLLTLVALVDSMANGIPPFGRLTLQSGKPVPDAAVSGAGTIYFAPYLGNLAQLDEVAFSFAEMQLNVASVLAGDAHDVFLCKNVVEEVVTYYIGYGPAWATVNSRGTGVGTTELVLKNGVWVNKVDMYLTCGAAETDVTVGPEEAKYLGSFLATANGQTSDNDTLGYLYNAYNQVERKNVVSSGNDHTYDGDWRNWNNTDETLLSVFLGLSGGYSQQLLGDFGVSDGGSLGYESIPIYFETRSSSLFVQNVGLGKISVIVKERTPLSYVEFFSVTSWLYALR